MEPDSGRRQHPLGALRTGLPIVAATIAIGASLALAYSSQQESRYEASAEVFITQQVSAEIVGSEGLSNTPERIIATQAEVARVPKVAERVVEISGVKNVTPNQLLSNTRVVPDPEADLLTFHVTWNDPDEAVDLANAYARGYVRYRNQLETGSIRAAQRELETQIEQVRQLENSEAQVASMIEEAQRLRTLSVLRKSGTEFGTPATKAEQIQPRPIRNAMLGGILGLVLGIAIVFARDALNTRLRSVKEIEERLGLPLIARITPPDRALVRANKLAGLETPMSPEAEQYRMLATSFELLNLERGAYSVMITSALHGEGKSTTAANLGVALARRGERVVLLEADSRRPVQRKLFGLGSDTPGLADVALGNASLDKALVEVDLGDTGGGDEGRGSLSVLPGDPPPSSPGDFLMSDAVAEIVAQLAERSDLLLIDTPPLLYVSDAMALLVSGEIDCAIIAAGVGKVRRQDMDELRRILEGAPVVTLGFVATGTDAGEGYGGPYYREYTSTNGAGGRRSLLRRGKGGFERSASQD